ncbi:MAG: hypothetical protein COA85_10890 [Robiginitomaculum sp.]|nr:MAG: hypothetical protein COA85_10890 [Robiginitomaculum sp.]
MSTFDEALAVHPDGNGIWRAHADPRCEANTGMFGGWTAAILLKAILADAQHHGEPIAVTTNFISRIIPGDDVTIGTTHLGGGRSLNNWRADLYKTGENEILSSAMVVMASRRESDTFTEWNMPDAPAPDGLEIFHPRGTFGLSVEFRTVSGFPPINQPDTKSLHWIREASGRAHDAVQLVYLADCFPPRVFYMSEAYRPSSSITMSVYLYATADELSRIGGDDILSEVIGTRAEQSTAGAKLRFWSKDGALIATSEQMCWFR